MNDEIRIETEAVVNAGRTAIGMCVAFAMGFLFGATVVALFDYYDNKKQQLNRIKRDSDENYIYSE